MQGGQRIRPPPHDFGPHTHTHTLFPPQIVVADITARVAAIVADTGVREGVVTLLSKHTTVGLTINESESRLARDVEAWLLSLAPPDDRSTAGTPGRGVRYAHNDIDQRPGDGDERERCLQNGWAVDAVDGPRGLAAWRAQEPVNAHSHLLAMLLGASEAVPVSGGRMTIGQWQSLLMVDTDGPRERTVGVQVMGYK